MNLANLILSQIACTTMVVLSHRRAQIQTHDSWSSWSKEDMTELSWRQSLTQFRRGLLEASIGTSVNTGQRLCMSEPLALPTAAVVLASAQDRPPRGSDQRHRLRLDLPVTVE